MCAVPKQVRIWRAKWLRTRVLMSIISVSGWETQTCGHFVLQDCRVHVFTHTEHLEPVDNRMQALWANISWKRECKACQNVVIKWELEIMFWGDQNLYRKQAGRSWKPFGEGKNGHKNFRQARLGYFRDEWVVFAHNCKFENSTPYNI